MLQLRPQISKLICSRGVRGHAPPDPSRAYECPAVPGVYKFLQKSAPPVCQFPDPPLILPIANNGSYEKSLEVSVLGLFIGPIVMIVVR